MVEILLNNVFIDIILGYQISLFLEFQKLLQNIKKNNYPIFLRGAFRGGYFLFIFRILYFCIDNHLLGRVLKFDKISISQSWDMRLWARLWRNLPHLGEESCFADWLFIESSICFLTEINTMQNERIKKVLYSFILHCIYFS